MMLPIFNAQSEKKVIKLSKYFNLIKSWPIFNEQLNLLRVLFGQRFEFILKSLHQGRYGEAAHVVLAAVAPPDPVLL